MPANTQLLLGLPGSTTAQRASFATKSLWVTPYDEEQLYPGGMYPLQNIHTGGLAEWTKQVGLPGSWPCSVLAFDMHSRTRSPSCHSACAGCEFDVSLGVCTMPDRSSPLLLINFFKPCLCCACRGGPLTLAMTPSSGMCSVRFPGLLIPVRMTPNRLRKLWWCSVQGSELSQYV